MDLESVDLLELVQKDTQLKKVSSTGGGEYAGACPFCGGQDRFRLQLLAPPGKRPEGSRWMCRQCSPRWSDAAGYVMKRDNCTFKEALKILGVASRPGSHPYLKNEPVDTNRLDWIDQGERFIEEAIDALWGCDGAKALAWLHARGLSDDALKTWNIGYNRCDHWGISVEWGMPADEKFWLPKGIVIPCRDQGGLHYINVRRPVGDPKYFKLKGSAGWLFGADTLRESFFAFLFEGEFDAILASQTGLGVGFISLPASSQILSMWAHLFGEVDNVIVAYDNDEPGRKAAEKFLRLPGFQLAQPLPMGKDPTEFVQLGGDLFEWICDQIGLIDTKGASV